MFLLASLEPSGFSMKDTNLAWSAFGFFAAAFSTPSLPYTKLPFTSVISNVTSPAKSLVAMSRAIGAVGSSINSISAAAVEPTTTLISAEKLPVVRVIR